MLSKYIGHLSGRTKKKAGEKLAQADALRGRRQAQLDHYKSKGKFQGTKYEKKYQAHKKFQDELARKRAGMHGKDISKMPHESKLKNDRMKWATGKVGRADHRAGRAKKAYGLARTGQQRARLGTAAGVVGVGGGAYAINKLQGSPEAKKKKRTSTKYTRFSNKLDNLIQLNERLAEEVEFGVLGGLRKIGGALAGKGSQMGGKLLGKAKDQFPRWQKKPQSLYAKTKGRAGLPPVPGQPGAQMPKTGPQGQTLSPDGRPLT